MGDRRELRYVTQRQFGGPEVLELATRSIPQPGFGEVLVRMAATSLNPIDSKTRQGRGAAQAMGALPISVGWDAAGVVEAAGDGVDPGLVGKAVFGMPRFPQEAAAYATHVVAPARDLAIAPVGLDWVSAAAVPLAGLTALSAVRDLALVEAGQRIFIRGAGGGVGHFAVQMAKAAGAEVLASVREEKADFVRSLGADEVVPRHLHAASVLSGSVDSVIDFIGGPALAESVQLTRPGGVVVCVPGGMDAGLDEAAARHGVRAARTNVRPSRDGLETLAAWLADGSIAVHVSEIFELDDVVEAHRRLDAGSLRGKLVLRIDTGLRYPD